ncbi:sensor histidine kinase [Actinobacteria bacterium YIM 96077]|uniref:histidine kinase n=2 Tax=Phytoactinopolyspora halophila TaxID=1981511 RepID=A0A329R2J9_9ACTN|nr:sensor histidine kinase [Actinobacteria bacterium YIM 96077]RAW17712.1 sensor histidine kinase [Phytoactinopolyspora halophila]
MPWLLAFGVFWIAMASIQETLIVHDLVLPFFAGLIVLPVGIARDYALLGWRLATVVALIIAVIGTPSPSGQDPGTWPVIQQWVWLAMTFLVSVRHDRATTLWVWAASVATMSAGTVNDTGQAVTLVVTTSAAVLIGDLLRTRRLASHEVERQAELSELEKARRTVLEERTRIARDLHDVVAHHMSMVVVQAESAPYRLDELSETARAEFTAISASARQALVEIRSMLGVLRSEDHTVATAPQPGLDQVHELVDSVAHSGVPVHMETAGTPITVSAATGLSAYRIVQESVANASRHAPGAPVVVHLRYAGDTIELRVTNDPPAVPVAAGAPGHGLIGMRERASVVGGSLDAGPLPDGGYEVVAVLPVDVEESTGEQ